MIKSYKKDKQTYLRLLQYLKPYRGRFSVAFLSSIPASLLNGAFAWIVGPMLDQVIKHHNYGVLSLIPVLIFVALNLQSFFEYLSDYAGTHVAACINRDLRGELFYSLSRMDLDFFKKHTSGEIYNRYFKDPVQLEQAIVSNLQGFIVQFFSLIFLMGVLIYRNPWMALISLVIMSFVVVPLHYLSKKIRQLDYQLNQIARVLFNRFQESISGVKVIHSFNLAVYQQKRYNKSSVDFFSSTMRIQKTSIILKPLMQLISSIGIAAILYIGSIQVQNGSMSPGELASFVLALVLLYRPVKIIGGIFGKVQRILAPAERVFAAIDLKPGLKDTENPKPLTHVESVELRNVSFEYKKNKPTLKNINLTIRSGEIIALVGPSGGGKTTLVDLIARFMDPSQGEVCFNGINIQEVSLYSLREMIALVSQETILFEGTIRENIKLGRLDATDEEVELAAKSANITEWVNSLEDGLDTQIGEKGVLVSGGQKQRISIARAFLKNAPLLILDEATSALDNESESYVQEALFSLMQNKTVIAIAHRLSTIKHADRILVVDAGEIVEEGTHAELLEKQGLYHRLYMLQFRNEEMVPV